MQVATTSHLEFSFVPSEMLSEWKRLSLCSNLCSSLMDANMKFQSLISSFLNEYIEFSLKFGVKKDELYLLDLDYDDECVDIALVCYLSRRHYRLMDCYVHALKGCLSNEKILDVDSEFFSFQLFVSSLIGEYGAKVSLLSCRNYDSKMVDFIKTKIKISVNLKEIFL